MVSTLDDPQIFSLALKDVYIPSEALAASVARKQRFIDSEIFLDETVVRFYSEINSVLLLCMPQAYLF